RGTRGRARRPSSWCARGGRTGASRRGRRTVTSVATISIRTSTRNRGPSGDDLVQPRVRPIEMEGRSVIFLSGNRRLEGTHGGLRGPRDRVLGQAGRGGDEPVVHAAPE